MKTKAQINTLGISIIALVIAAVFLIFGLIIIQELENTAIISSTDGVLADVNSPQTLEFTPIEVTGSTRLNDTWLKFDGLDDRISVSNSIVNVSNYTFMFWINQTNNDSNNWYTTAIVDGVYMRSRTGGILQMFNERGTDLRSSEEIPTNNWTHIAFICEGNQGIVYINSINKTSLNPALNKCNGTAIPNPFLIGRSSDTHNGSLDEFYFINRSLKSYNIVEIYNQSVHNFNLGKRIPFIYYHEIADNSSPLLSPSIELFNQTMKWLSDNEFETITVTNYLSWTNGDFLMPKKPIILMFDDASRSIFTNATPILDEYGFIGSLAVPTSRPDVLSTTMNWSEILNLSNKGWEIVSHSATHINFVENNLSDDEANSNFTVSKQDILDNIGLTTSVFVFPNNAFNSTYTNLCSQHYSVCFGDAGVIGSSINAQTFYGYITTNLTNGNLWRMEVRNDTRSTLVDIQNHVYPEYRTMFQLNLNENTGTTAFDQSDNGNNGTITGATYNNDGINIALTRNVDYNLTNNIFEILNSELAWSNLTLTFSTHSDASSSVNKTLIGLSTFADFWEIIVLAVVITIVIGLLLVVFGSNRQR